MKAFFYLLIAILIVSCGQKNNSDSKNSDYYSTKIDTLYNRIDRTKIDEIKRYIYEKRSSDFEKSLTFSTNLKGDKSSAKFSIIKLDLTDRDNYKSDGLFFDNVSEVKSLFSKIDTLGVDTSLNERKKIKHYEISKGQYRIDVKQYDGGLNIVKELSFSNSEYDGIKSSFEKYLLENQ